MTQPEAPSGGSPFPPPASSSTASSIQSRRLARVGVGALATLLIAASVGFVTATSHEAQQGLVFGPPSPEHNGLPAWVASQGSSQCWLSIPDGEDHGPYYELGGRDTQNGIEARYGAAVEGLPEGAEPPEETEPVVANGARVRLDGLTPGETYTIQEPHGIFDGLTFTAVESRARFEIEGADPQRGPVTDLTIRSGEFRLLRGTQVVVEFELEHFCGAATGEPVNAPPIARFTYTCPVLRMCDFDGRDSIDPDGGIVSWEWDFGDGTSGTGPTTRHLYTADGTYSVTLTVTDDEGATDTLTMNVDVRALPLPAA